MQKGVGFRAYGSRLYGRRQYKPELIPLCKHDFHLTFHVLVRSIGNYLGLLSSSQASLRFILHLFPVDSPVVP